MHLPLRGCLIPGVVAAVVAYIPLPLVAMAALVEVEAEHLMVALLAPAGLDTIQGQMVVAPQVAATLEQTLAVEAAETGEVITTVVMAALELLLLNTSVSHTKTLQSLPDRLHGLRLLASRRLTTLW